MHPDQYAEMLAGSMPSTSPSSEVTVEAVAPARGQRSPTAPPTVDDETLLTSGQVRARVGNVTAMALWRWQRDPRVKFPLPDMMINGRRYWRMGTLRCWQAERVTDAA